MLKEIWRFWAKITTSFLSCTWRPSSKQPQCLSPESSYFFNLSIHAEPRVVGAGGLRCFFVDFPSRRVKFLLWAVNKSGLFGLHWEMKSPIIWEYLSKPTGIYMESHQTIPSKNYVTMCFPWVFLFFTSGRFRVEKTTYPRTWRQWLGWQGFWRITESKCEKNGVESHNFWQSEACKHPKTLLLQQYGWRIDETKSEVLFSFWKRLDQSGQGAVDHRQSQWSFVGG